MKITYKKSGPVIILVCLLCSSILFAQSGQKKEPRQPKQPRKSQNVFDADSKKQLERDLGPDWENIILEQVRLNDPLTLADLERMKQKDPQRYEFKLQQLYKEYETLENLKEIDPERYEKTIKQRRLNRDSKALVREFNKTEDDGRKTEIKTQLRAILDELFTLREAEKEEKISRLEKELEKLREMVALRKTKKNDIIEARLNELLEEDKGLKW